MKQMRMKAAWRLAALAAVGLTAGAATAGQEFDLVIYGSSSAAISAAVQAKRMGVSAVIVSPETRIGGLTTGGLGQTDIGNKSAFGGIALEFYRAVADYYRDEKNWTHEQRGDYLPDGQCAGSKGEDSMWTFEPSAALKILEGWEQRDGLVIHRGKRLDRSNGGVKVEKRGGGGERIVAFFTEDGTEYRGKMFIDATYEGDLLAAVGVSYTVGREANAVYGETLNGVQTAQAVYHQFEKGVDPYVEPGNPQSGLLPNIEPYNAREQDGDGDRRMQAYCFRMCLTDDPENRIPFAKPANYDERNYELLFRQFAAKPKETFEGDLTWKLPWINSRMPNRKTDTNNRDGFSSDFIGRNWAWPEASYAEREKILKEHLDYQRGLMWTLANHPRVPAKVRAVVSRWGTCRDEFQDGLGDGWQRQLYVREGRRMVGEYVMTEANCVHRRMAPHPVAMAAYTMDSHHVRRRVGADGFVHNEGDVEVGCDAGPYGIDYGAIVPRRGECANLFVPVALSASHIAFGSIRMEPVFFALGQAAATAAAQAVRAGCAVQELPYAPLAARLLADGQVIGRATADEPMAGTILPLGEISLPVTEECIRNTVKQIREVVARSGIRKIALGGPGHSVRVSGRLPVEKYRELGKGVAAVKEIVAKDGIEVGFRMGPTVNVGSNHPWRHFTREDGSERAFTACPADAGFRSEFARQCAAVAGECRPFLYMMEDDFRYWGSGCFCPEHVAAISAAEGVHFTRESLLKALRAHESPKSAQLRMRWFKLQEDSLVALATAAEQAIHAVSPETRVALSAPGMLMDTTIEAIARALAGPGRRPLVRWWGAIYDTDYPLDLTSILFHARWAKENVSEGIDCFYEADPCPRSAFFASGARLSAMCSTVSAFGFDGLWYWGAGPGGIYEAPQYLDEHKEQAGRFAAIRAEAKTGKLVGVSVPMSMQTRALWQCGIPSWERPLDESAGARLLNRLGIPLTTRPGAVALYTGHWAFEGMSDEEVKKILSGGVILDGAAAEALTWRGFAELMGVKAEARDRIDFTGEKYTESGYVTGCSFHANYGLDDCRVSRLTAQGAEEVGYFFDTTPERHVQPSITRYQNQSGGRVAVIAVNLANAKTANLYNLAKRKLLVQVIRWVGGEEALPVWIADCANMMAVASENADAGRLMVHALNLSCDTCRGITFEVSERYRSATVEVLDGDEWREIEAVRKGRELTIPCELAVYRTLVCRLSVGMVDAAGSYER